MRKRLLPLKLQGSRTLVKNLKNVDNLIRGMLATVTKMDETDKVTHLLLTIPNTYDGVITTIEKLSNGNINLSFVNTR